MKTSDPSQPSSPYEDQPTQPLGPGESFGPAFDAESDADLMPIGAALPPDSTQPTLGQGNTDAWLRQTGPMPGVNSAGASQTARIAGTSARQNSNPPHWKAKRGGPLVSRRTLLVGAGIAGLGVAAAATGVGLHSIFSSQNKNAVAPAGNQQIAHLLRRAGFGAAPGELETYSALGINGAVDRLLNYQNIPNTDMDQRIAAANFNFGKIQDTLNWWLARMTYSTHPLEEKMTLFWHGLLTSSFRKVGGQRGFPFIKQNNDFLRQNAFGRFDDILAGITIDPAMLIWLDGNGSRTGAPNENFAREEMELFSLGIGNYTQTDIEQSARALTGWRISPLTGKAVLIPRLHDTGQKT